MTHHFQLKLGNLYCFLENANFWN